mmetsp:Transcript_1090/g.2369  ORF Transcript_1090/g.2369 Transcript_1090/m.2369 type:complete len:212 (+) Transcript_1090:369-1004(+)
MFHFELLSVGEMERVPVLLQPRSKGVLLDPVLVSASSRNDVDKLLVKCHSILLPLSLLQVQLCPVLELDLHLLHLVDVILERFAHDVFVFVRHSQHHTRAALPIHPPERDHKRREPRLHGRVSGGGGGPRAFTKFLDHVRVLHNIIKLLVLAVARKAAPAGLARRRPPLRRGAPPGLGRQHNVCVDLSRAPCTRPIAAGENPAVLCRPAVL